MSCCDGRCCAVFTFPQTPEQLQRRWSRWPSTAEYCRDDLYIADMLIPLDLVAVAKRTAKFGIVHPGVEGKNWYTCKHWDEDTRLCTAYEERPKMCRDYPYGRTCDHGCGFRVEPHVAVKWAGYRVKSYKPPLMLGSGA